jgi:sialate O-acetylesterase
VVLQRNEELKIWGWAAANEKVKLIFKAKEYFTTADNLGKWIIKLPKQAAGGPYQLEFKASNVITVSDVLFGDVWVCSGQSNMELPMERVKGKYEAVIKNATNSSIRQFLVPDKYDFKSELEDFDSGSWVSCSPENVLNFSAVAYFFAKSISEKYNVPIGLINTSLGGSPVEAWMSEEALKPFPLAYQEVQKFKNDSLIDAIQQKDQKRNDDWYAEINSKDNGLSNNKPIWNQLTTDDSDWKEMQIPGYWADGALGNVNGVVWFRKEITIPKSAAGKAAKLVLGRIVDQDFVYINEDFVGTTGYQYPPRIYPVNANVLKEGKNTITVRVINNSGRGGFVLDKPYYLVVEKDTIKLQGAWKYKLGTEMKPLAGPTFIRWKPAGLYNAMIAPLLNFKIKGAIWYQGESNTSNPSNYNKTFPAMIANWRARWTQGNFPFLFVQLANFMEEKSIPAESNWAALRQAQLESLAVPNTGMAVAIDLGEWNDIHPLNKEDVGKRLALQAQRIAYHEKNDMASGPIPDNYNFAKDYVMISFKNIGKGLISKGSSELNYFSISNDGKNFVWAKAQIIENQVKVWNDSIQNPIIVRYAWADNPQTANLFSREGLPATPFQIQKKQ